MRLFNDMVTSILQCDKPVICRVNGMRVGGGQEIGMACDFSLATAGLSAPHDPWALADPDTSRRAHLAHARRWSTLLAKDIVRRARERY